MTFDRYVRQEYYRYCVDLIDSFEKGQTIKILAENGQWLKVSEKWGNSFDIVENVYIRPVDISGMSQELRDFINHECNRTRNLKTYRKTKDGSIFQRFEDYLNLAG